MTGTTEANRGWPGDSTQPLIFRKGVKFEKCPIAASLGVLGKKWTLLILRDIGLRGIDRFNRLLESISGITPRMLSRRLDELERSGFIERIEERRTPRVVRWAVTAMGRDVFPVLLQLVVFGSKWYAGEVFSDKRARTWSELFEPDIPFLTESTNYH
ncbi:MAG: helix-turn-helix transcriptional regulator [Nitrososphaerota archaeon]|nr:helix-turn-helix transcriptional regulator [Nitrososphaerota archaeon]